MPFHWVDFQFRLYTKCICYGVTKMLNEAHLVSYSTVNHVIDDHLIFDENRFLFTIQIFHYVSLMSLCTGDAK